MTNAGKLADVASGLAVALFVIWIVAALLTEPNIWIGDAAQKLILPLVLISVAVRLAAYRTNG